MAQFDVYSTAVENIISWIKSGEVAIPEIQRPFVWDATKVRDLLDSSYNGFPVGSILPHLPHSSSEERSEGLPVQSDQCSILD